MKKQKYKSPKERMKNLKFLSGMDINLKIKRKLREQGKKWIKYIKLHSEEIKHPYNNMYHLGEIAFIELFFFAKHAKRAE